MASKVPTSNTNSKNLGNQFQQFSHFNLNNINPSNPSNYSQIYVVECPKRTHKNLWNLTLMLWAYKIPKTYKKRLKIARVNK